MQDRDTDEFWVWKAGRYPKFGTVKMLVLKTITCNQHRRLFFEYNKGAIGPAFRNLDFTSVVKTVGHPLLYTFD